MFNSAAPIRSFPSRTMPAPALQRSTKNRAPLASLSEKPNVSKTPAAKVENKPVLITNLSSSPPNIQDKTLPSSPIIPHHQSLDIKRLSAEPQNKHVPTISFESKDDSPNSGNSPRDLKKCIGPWRLGCTLGEGATGRVRKAQHIRTGQFAAVKIMNKHDATTLRSQSVICMDQELAAEQITRNKLPFGLEREIVIMKLVDHEHITKLFDLWENRGEIYLVLEHVDGGELFRYICERGFLDEKEAFRLFRQLLSAVDYLHVFRICHRDIKPENILINSDGNLKLADFGMASREHLGGLFTSCGSPHYAPPEIAIGGEYTGAHVDVWSIGVVLYVMLVGAIPFGPHLAPDDIEGVLIEIVEKEPVYSDNLSEDCLALLVQMLQKDPYLRITTEEIWKQPIMEYYQQVADIAPDPHRWTGGPQLPLTTADCGPALKPEEIDEGIAAGVCVLWHAVHQDQVYENLTSPKPNYERVMYRNLLRFQEASEALYHCSDLEHAESDVHHIRKRSTRAKSDADNAQSKYGDAVEATPKYRPLPRSVSSRISISQNMKNMKKGNLLGAVKSTTEEDPYKSPTLSSGSHFAISGPPQLRPSTSKKSIQHYASKSSSSRRGPTRTTSTGSIVLSEPSRGSSQRSKSTNKSYDPYRASSTGHPATEADYAKITVLNQRSTLSSGYDYSSYANAQRRPPGARMNSEGSRMVSEESSVPSSVHSMPRDHNGVNRELRRSLLLARQNSASSWASTTMSSSSYCRFPVPPVASKKNIHMPEVIKKKISPVRPRNPTPLTMQERFVQDASKARDSSFSPVPEQVVRKLTQDVTVQRKHNKMLKLEPPANLHRTSILWEQTTREASAELSALMDEVFADDLEAQLWDEETKKAKEQEFIRRSFSLPRLRETGYEQRPLPQLPIKKPEAPPPCTNPVKLRSIYEADTVEELLHARETLEKHANDLGSDALRSVIEHLDRLIAERPEAHGKRVASLPEAKQRKCAGATLSPVVEDNETRSVSSPVPGKYGSFHQNKSTVRLVFDDEDDASLYPAPLRIKKKASAPLLSSPRNKGRDIGLDGRKTPQSRLKSGGSTATLGHMFERNNRSTSAVHVTPALSPRSSSAIDNVNNSQEEIPITKNWFRRSNASGEKIETIHSTEVQDPESRGSRSNTTTSGTDFPFRMPQRESKLAKFKRFFKGGSKEKRMQIVVNENEDCSDQASVSVQTPAATARWRQPEATTLGLHPLYNTISVMSMRHPLYHQFNPAPALNARQPEAQATRSQLPRTTTMRTISRGRGRLSEQPVVMTSKGLRYATPSSPHLYNKRVKNQDAEEDRPVNLFQKFFADLKVYVAQQTPKPVTICMTLNIQDAIQEVRSLLRGWKQYGLGKTTYNKGMQMITSSISAENKLGLLPCTFQVYLLEIMIQGEPSGISIAKVSWVEGNGKSFEEVCKTLKNVLRYRNLLVKDKAHVREMRASLRAWEKSVPQPTKRR